MPEGSISRNTAQNKGKGNWGCLIAFVATQVFFVLLFILVGVSIWIAKAGSSMPSGSGVDENPQLKEIWSSGSGQTKAVIIPVRGFIGMDSGDDLFSSGYSPTAVLLNSITRATADRSVSAIILNVDSGGGGITASDIIYMALKNFKSSRSDRVIVVLMGDVAASGAYYVSLPADHIIAHPTSITGSIGVLMQVINMKGLGDKIGITGVTIKSGANKDLLNPFEDVSGEHREILQNVVNKLQDRFVSLVAENRKIPVSKVRELADGRIFTSEEAKQMGLIDSIGYFEDAVQQTKTLLNVDELRVFRYQKEFSISMLFKASNSIKELSAIFPSNQRSGFFYLWDPSLISTR